MACYTKPFNLCPQGVINSKCVVYTGSNLTNISVSTNDRLDVILQSINEAVGDFDFNLFIENTDSINLSGDGTSSSPLTANLNISASTGNLVQLLADGVFVEDITEDVTYIVNNVINNVVYDTFDGTFLIDGGEISWVEDYTYLVSAGNYVILGDTYASPETQIILDPADGTFDRIDLVVLDTNGDVIVITGTPALNPQEPSFDPQTQIPLQFITVVAATTADPCAVDTPIYTDNLGTGGGEWNAVSSSGTINVNSTNFPQTGTKDIEATNAVINATVTFTPAAPLSLSTHTQLNFYIRSKGTWIGGNPNNSKRLVITFFNGVTQVGDAVLILGTGNYGFNSATTGIYQQISIPKANFNITNETITHLTMRVSGNQGTMGFYLDNISLETNCNSTPPEPSVFTLNTSSTDTIALSATGSGTSSNPLTASLIVGPTDNTEQNFMMWDGDSVELRTLSSLGIISAITADNGLTANTATNVRLGGTLLQDTTITQGNFRMFFTGSGSAGTVVNIDNTGAFDAIALDVSGSGDSSMSRFINTSGGGAAIFSNNQGTGYGIETWTTTNYALVGRVGSGSASAVNSVLLLQKHASGAGADGIGASIDFSPETSTNTNRISTQIISKWTTAADATRVSQAIITGVNNAVTADLLTISGSGSTRLNKYGISTFTGTAATYAAFDSSGNIIEVSGVGSGPVITADNGLTKNSATNVQLGSATQGDANSPLLHTTYINTTSAYQFIASGGNATSTFRGINTSSGHGIEGISTSGTGVSGNSTSGVGGGFTSSSTYALSAITNSTSTPSAYIQLNSSTTGVSQIMQLVRLTTGAVADGLGGSLRFVIEDNTGAGSGFERLSNQLISKWTTAATATRTSQFIITGVNNAIEGDIFTLNGNKSIQLNGYGINTFAGTPTFTLGVDASGNVVEFTSAGAGANTALSNLASVAINTSLISDTDNTDDLGSASISWKDAYVRTVKFDGSTSGTVTVQATAVAGTPTLTLPTVTGTITQYVEGTTASSSTPTPTGDARENYYDVTALAEGATFGAPTGTPANHNSLLIRVKDNGTARTLAFNAIYRGGGDIALPTTTVLGKVMYLQFTYNSQDSFWDLVGLTNNI